LIEFYIRDDDNEEKIKERLKTYHENTDNILDYYKKQGKLIELNGDQLIQDVFQDLVKYMVDDLRSKIK
jgi:adenylate kinase